MPGFKLIKRPPYTPDLTAFDIYLFKKCHSVPMMMYICSDGKENEPVHEICNNLAF